MKIKHLFSVLCSAILFLSSCKECPELRSPAAPQSPYKWLEGTWQMKSDSLEIVENWRTTDAEMMKGSAFVVVRRDTVLHETLRLLQVGTKWVYIARIDEDPVLFTMRPGDNQQELLFENDEHDFPQRIRYTKVDDTHIKASVEGIDEGKPAVEEYSYTKIK
jgi:hypothetical protein